MIPINDRFILAADVQEFLAWVLLVAVASLVILAAATVAAGGTDADGDKRA